MLLWARGYSTETDIPNQVFPFKHLPKEDFSASLLPWKNWNKIRKLDEWLGSITDNQHFVFYTPQSGMNFFYILVSSHLCAGYCYLEEGRSSYFREAQMRNPKKSSVLKDLFYRTNFQGRSKSIKHFFDFEHVKFKTCYGISEHTFPDAPNKSIIQIPFQQKNFSEEYHRILVPEPIVEFGIVSPENYRKLMIWFMEWAVKMGVLELHVKYHPGQQESVKIMQEVFREFPTITIKEIDKTVSLEEIAVSTSADFFIITSSVGIYSLLAGRRVYSLAKQLVNLDGSYQKAIDDLPDFFKKQLIYLN